MFKLMSVESVMPSNHLILCRPLLLSPLIFPSIRVSSSESVLCIRWPKCWSFVISPSIEYSGLIPLGLTGWISLLSKGLSRAFSSTMVQKHQFFGTQPSLWSSSYICTWLLEKTIASTIWSFVLYLVRNLVVVVSWFSSGQSAYIIILSVLYINSVYFVKKQIKKIFSTFFFVPFTSIYCHFCGLERSLRPGAIVRVCVRLLSRARLFATPRTAAHQTPLSVRFSRQGYWSGLPFPSPGDLPNPGIKPGSPALQADSSPTELQGKLPQSDKQLILRHQQDIWEFFWFLILCTWK